MSKNNRTILVVDTQEQDWAGELRDQIGSLFEVLLARDPNMAFASFRNLRPWAVVMRLNLNDDINGLQMSRMLRHQPGGRKCLIIVHGEPSPTDKLPKAEEIKNYWPVDYFIPERDALASDIGTLLEAHLKLPRSVTLQRAKGNMASSSSQLATKLNADLSPDEVSWKELMRQKVSSNTVRALLTKEFHIIGTDEDDVSLDEAAQADRDIRELTWKQLLRQGIGFESVKALLTKPVGLQPPPKDGDLDSLSWVNLLQQEVSLGGLRALLTKDIFTEGGDHPEDDQANPAKPTDA